MRRGLLGWLARTPVILCFLGATLLIGVGFLFLRQAIDGPLLDEISSGSAAISRFNEMDFYARKYHFWGTVTLDVLYPLAYGGLFIGLLCRLAWPWRWLLILVPIMAMLADFAENTVQAMALNGYPVEILLAKNIVTPLKAGALVVILVLCLLLGGGAWVRKKMQIDKRGALND